MRLAFNMVLGIFVSLDVSMAGMYLYIVLLLVVHAGTTAYELRNSTGANALLVFAVLMVSGMSIRPLRHQNTITLMFFSLNSLCELSKELRWNTPLALQHMVGSRTYGT